MCPDAYLLRKHAKIICIKCDSSEIQDVIRSLVGNNKGLSAIRITVINKYYKKQKYVICWFPTLLHICSKSYMVFHPMTFDLEWH